jgi:hypothetical protein
VVPWEPFHYGHYAHDLAARGGLCLDQTVFIVQRVALALRFDGFGA